MPAVTSVNPSASVSQDIKGLLLNQKWAVNSFTFSFPTSASFYETGSAPNGETTSNFAALNSTQQTYVRNYALAQFAAVANLTFSVMTETSSNHADLRFARTDATSTAWGYYPATPGYGGDTWYRNSGGSYDNPVIGNYAGHTFLHEIGHAMGLVHGHDPSNPFGPLPSSHDSVEYSIMTYRSYVGGPSSGVHLRECERPANFDAKRYCGSAISLRRQLQHQQRQHRLFLEPVHRPDLHQRRQHGRGRGQQDLPDHLGRQRRRHLQSVCLLDQSIDRSSARRVEHVRPSLPRSAPALGSGNFAAGNVANALLYNGNTQSLIENVIGGTGSDTIVGNVIANNLQRRRRQRHAERTGGRRRSDRRIGGGYLPVRCVPHFDGSLRPACGLQLFRQAIISTCLHLFRNSATLSSYLRSGRRRPPMFHRCLSTGTEAARLTAGRTIAQVDGLSAGAAYVCLLGGWNNNRYRR